MQTPWINQRDQLHQEIARLRRTIEYKECEIHELRSILICQDVDLTQCWHLTRTERDIIGALMSGIILSREQIMTAVYPKDSDRPDEKIIDVFITKIRRKLEGSPVQIETVRGHGYRLQPKMIALIKQLCAPPVALSA